MDESSLSIGRVKRELIAWWSMHCDATDVSMSFTTAMVGGSRMAISTKVNNDLNEVGLAGLLCLI